MTATGSGIVTNPMLPTKGEEIIDTVRRVIKTELLSPTFNGDASSVYSGLFVYIDKYQIGLPFLGYVNLPLIKRKDPTTSRTGRLNSWLVLSSDLSTENDYMSPFYDTSYQPGKHFWVDSLLVTINYVEHELNKWLKYRSCKLRSINNVVTKTWSKDSRDGSYTGVVPAYLRHKDVYESKVFRTSMKKTASVDNFIRDKNIEFADEMADYMLADLKVTKQKLFELKEALDTVRIEMANGIK